MITMLIIFLMGLFLPKEKGELNTKFLLLIPTTLIAVALVSIRIYVPLDQAEVNGFQKGVKKEILSDSKRLVTRKDETINPNKTTLISALGSVRSMEYKTLHWSFLGEVDAVHVTVGDYVSKDELLMSLEKESLYAPRLDNHDTVLYTDLEQAYEFAKEEKKLFEESYGDLAIASKRGELEEQRKVVEASSYQVWRSENYPTQEMIDQAYARMVIGKKEYGEAEKVYKDFLWTRTNPEYMTDEGARRWLELKLEQDLILNEAMQTYNDDIYAYERVLRGFSDLQKEGFKADHEYQQQVLEGLEKELNKLLDGPSQEKIDSMNKKVEDAKKKLDDFQLWAPFDGRITQVFTKEDERVVTGTEALRIDNWKKRMVVASVLEIDVAQIKIGAPVEIRFEAYPDFVYSGHVKSVGYVNDDAQNKKSEIEEEKLH